MARRVPRPNKSTPVLEVDGISLAQSWFDYLGYVDGQIQSTSKAWVKFTGSAVNGPQTIVASYNVSGVSRTAAGTYTVTFSTPFSSADYACFVTQVTGSNPAWGQVQNGGMAAGSVQVGFLTVPLAGSDPASGMVVCFGTQ